MTAQGPASTRFKHAVEKRALFLAETAAFEMNTLTLEDALALVVLYAENEDDKFERAAVRWLGRLMHDRPMDLAVEAQSVELVASCVDPGRSGRLVRSRHLHANEPQVRAHSLRPIQLNVADAPAANQVIRSDDAMPDRPERNADEDEDEER